MLTEVTPDMPAFQEEIFGPVAPITVVDNEDEAVRVANSTDYGLVASAPVHWNEVSQLHAA